MNGEIIGSFCCSPPAWHKLRLCCTRPMAAKLADNMCVIGSFCCSPPMAAKLADNMCVIGSFCFSPPMAAKLADNMCVIGSFCFSPPMAAKLADNKTLFCHSITTSSASPMRSYPPTITRSPGFSPFITSKYSGF